MHLTFAANACDQGRRPLDRVERFFFALDAIQRQNFAIHVRLRHPLDEMAVRRAFSRLINLHECLRTVPAISPDLGPCLNTAPAQIGDPCLLGPDWEHLRNHALTLDMRGGPGVRCLLVGHGGRVERIALAFHHAIMDGRGAVALLGDLLRLTLGIAPKYSPQPLASPFEPALSTERISTASRRWMQEMHAIQRSVRLPLRPADIASCLPMVKSITLATGSHARLRTESQAIGVSTHAMLAGHALLALRDAMGPGEASLALSHAVDLRRFEDDPPVLACRAGLLLGRHKISAGDSTSAVAVDVQTQVQAGLDCAFLAWLLNVLPWLGQAGDHAADIDAARLGLESAPSYLVISDLGAVDREWNGVCDAVTQAGLTVQPLPGQLAVLTRVDLGGRCHLQLHTRRSATTEALLHRLAAGLTERLGAHASPAPGLLAPCPETA